MMSRFLLFAFAVATLFMVLDLLLYFFRKNHKFSDYAQPTLDRVGHRISHLLSRIPDSQIRLFFNKLSNKVSILFERQIPFAKVVPEPPNEIKITPQITRDISINYLQRQLPNNSNIGEIDRLVHIQISTDLPEGTILQLAVKVENGEALLHASVPDGLPQPTVSIPDPKGQFYQRLRRMMTFHPNLIALQLVGLDKFLLVASILIYAFVVGFHIDRYPIYFFTDEAAHMNLAANFIRDGFENYFGEFMPTFFTTEGWVNGTSVYLQVIPFLLFGKSVVVTRLVSAFISLLGAICAGLLVRDTLKLKYYWAGIFAVLTTPAWFLHSRTAFEYVEVAAFYSMFLYFYSRYRDGQLKSFYWAILAAALAFYTHGLGQILVTVSGIVLLITDFSYHFHPDRRKTITNGAFLILLVLMPFVRYYLAHPGEASGQIKRRGSYWANDSLPPFQKFFQFITQYFYGLNPFYWFIKNRVDLDRHTMDGYGNGLLLTFPIYLLGLYTALKNIKLPSYRLVIIALLVCPIPASVVAIGMPRMLWMTIPIALLTVIGLSEILQWIQLRWNLKSTSIAIGLFIVFALLSGYMLRDSLVNGPLWFQDYSLYGMQYGAKQVFQDVVSVGLRQDPDRRYIVSPSWANGTEQFVDFFIQPQFRNRIALGQPIDFIPDIRKNPDNIYFISTSAEYEKLINNPEFKDISVIEVLLYPNKAPGFYVLSLKASDNIDQLLAEEHLKNITPVEDSITLNGHDIKIIHSPLGSGRLEDIFDNNPDTLARVIEANPFVLDLYPSNQLDTHSILIQTGSLTKFTITIILYGTDPNLSTTYTHTYDNLPPDPIVSMTFDNGPFKSSRIYIEIKDDISGATSQIHVRTIQFK